MIESTYNYFEENYWLFDEKTAKIKGNLYDKYLEGTCSLTNYNREKIIDLV